MLVAWNLGIEKASQQSRGSNHNPKRKDSKKAQVTSNGSVTCSSLSRSEASSGWPTTVAAAPAAGRPLPPFREGVAEAPKTPGAEPAATEDALVFMRLYMRHARTHNQRVNQQIGVGVGGGKGPISSKALLLRIPASRLK